MASIRHGKGIAVVLFYAIFSISVMLVFVPGSNYLADNHPGTDERTKPVAYRVLVPLTAKALQAVIPQAVEDALTPGLISWRDSETGRQLLRLNRDRMPYQLEDARIFKTAVMLTVIYASLLAFIAMLYGLARRVFPDSSAYAVLAPALALLCVSAFAARYAYSYDFAELFFSAACLYLLFRQRFTAYLVCFALATLNKETSVFAIFFFAAWFFTRLPRRRYLELLALQIGVYAGVKLGLAWWLADVPNMYGEHAYINRLRDQFFYLYRYNYQEAVAFLITLGLLVYRWLYKPAFLRAGVWILLPNIGAYILTCNPGEYRDLYWSLPVAVLWVAHSLVQIFASSSISCVGKNEKYD